MGIWIIRLVMLVICPAVLWGCWQASGWLIEAGHLPGTTDPHYFGYGISQAIGAMIILMLLTLVMSVINWLIIWRPREKAKQEFWERRGKSWPR